MQLPEILQATSAICAIIGGCVLLGGAIVSGAGYLTGGTLLLIALVAGVWGAREDGPERRR